jgi:hypothetical protein
MMVQVDPDGTVTVAPEATTNGPKVPALLFDVPVNDVDATVWD